MTEMFFTEFSFGSPQFDQAIDLRNKVLRIPLNMEFYVNDIELEWKEHHFAVFLANYKMVACLSMRPIQEGVIKMRQVAVDEKYQGRGIGRYLVSKTELWCKSNGFATIELNARENAVSFYLSLNYSIVGDVFEEVGIPHFKMQKVID